MGDSRNKGGLKVLNTDIVAVTARARCRDYVMSDCPFCFRHRLARAARVLLAALNDLRN